MKPLAAALLGVLATLGFPPYEIFPLSLLALAGLIALWSSATPRQAMLYGLCYGLGHYLTGVYWVFISTYVYGGAPLWMGLFLAFLLAFICSLFLAAVGWLVTWRRPGSALLWGALQVPAAWLLMELLRGWDEVWSFPWLSVGYAFIDTSLVRLAPVFGVHGLSTMVIVLAAALWLLITGSLRQRAGALMFGLVTLLGLLWVPAPGGWTQAKGAELPVGIVQGDIPQERKWLASERLPTLQLYRGLSLELLRQYPDTRLVIWPEAAIPMLYNHVRGDFLVDLRQWAQGENLTVLTGILQKEPGGLYNTMRALGVDEGLYRKRHLVPFGEFFPVPDFLRAFMKGINLDYENLSHGPAEQPLVRVAGVGLGISICFEDVFGRDIRRELPEADILVNVTNDGWFADSSAPYQHLQIARMRAIETGRELVRVSNRGVSGRIGVDGVVRQQLPMFESGYLAFNARPYTGTTPYVAWGETPLWAGSILILIALFLLGQFGARKPGQSGSDQPPGSLH